MVLEIHVKLCVTELGFLGKNFLLQNLGNWTKNSPKTGFFESIERFGRYILLNLLFNENLYYFLLLHKWENFSSWDMGQIVLTQLDCKIF